MIEIPEAVEHALRRAPDDRRKVAALLLVRYCDFHGDPKFTPWFERSGQVLAQVTRGARAIVRQEPGTEPGTEPAELKAALQVVLEESDPDGPPFEAEIFDHLVFADEVLAFLLAPDEAGLLTQAYERAEELAEAHEEMGREDYPGDDWEPAELADLEADARTQDVRGDLDDGSALARSESFARAYAEVIEKCYTAEDAGADA